MSPRSGRQAAWVTLEALPQLPHLCRALVAKIVDAALPLGPVGHCRRAQAQLLGEVVHQHLGGRLFVVRDDAAQILQRAPLVKAAGVVLLVAGGQAIDGRLQRCIADHGVRANEVDVRAGQQLINVQRCQWHPRRTHLPDQRRRRRRAAGHQRHQPL